MEEKNNNVEIMDLKNKIKNLKEGTEKEDLKLNLNLMEKLKTISKEKIDYKLFYKNKKWNPIIKYINKIKNNNREIEILKKKIDISEKELKEEKDFDQNKNKIENLIKKINYLQNLYPKKLSITRIGNINKVSKEPEVIECTLEKIKKSYQKNKRELINEQLNNSDIIATTIDSTYINKDFILFIEECEKNPYYKNKNIFDFAIVDEAGKSQNFSNLGALINSDKVILLGDHLQLPPTFLSDKNYGKISLFEKNILKMKKLENLEEYIGTLNIQYRMDDQIMKLSSEFYPNL